MTPETVATFLGATARNSGLAFAPEALTAAAEQLAGAVERDATGAFSYSPEAGAAAFRVVAGEVVEIPAADFVASVILKHTQPVRTTAPAAAEAAATLATVPKPNTPIAAFGRALAASHDAAVLHEAETWPNPFVAGPNFNRTRQQIIVNKNPGLAARYRAEAGA